MGHCEEILYTCIKPLPNSVAPIILLPATRYEKFAVLVGITEIQIFPITPKVMLSLHSISFSWVSVSFRVEAVFEVYLYILAV